MSAAAASPPVREIVRVDDGPTTPAAYPTLCEQQGLGRPSVHGSSAPAQAGGGA